MEKSQQEQIHEFLLKNCGKKYTVAEIASAVGCQHNTVQARIWNINNTPSGTVVNKEAVWGRSYKKYWIDCDTKRHIVQVRNKCLHCGSYYRVGVMCNICGRPDK